MATIYCDVESITNLRLALPIMYCNFKLHFFNVPLNDFVKEFDVIVINVPATLRLLRIFCEHSIFADIIFIAWFPGTAVFNSMRFVYRSTKSLFIFSSI